MINSVSICLGKMRLASANLENPQNLSHATVRLKVKKGGCELSDHVIV